jgi:hypothetical protein
MTQAAARQISDVYKLAPTTADQTIVTAIYTDNPVWNAVTYRVTNEGANNVLFRDDGSAAVMPTVGTPQKGYSPQQAPRLAGYNPRAVAPAGGKPAWQPRG